MRAPIGTEKSTTMPRTITVKDFRELSDRSVCLVDGGQRDKVWEFCSCCLSIRPDLYKFSGSQYLCTKCFPKEEQNCANGNDSQERSTAKPVKWCVTWEDVEHLLGKCPNDGCDKEVELRDIEMHLERCLLRRIPCTLCGETISASDVLHHSQFICPKRPVTCQGCAVVIFAEEKEGHESCCCSRNGGSVDVTSDRKNKQEKGAKPINSEAGIQTLRKELLVVTRKLSMLEQEQKKQRCLLAASLRRPPVAYIWCIESYQKFKEEAGKSKDSYVSDPFYFGIAGCKFRLQANTVSLGNGQAEYLGVYVHMKVTDVERFDQFDYPQMKCAVQIASRTRTAETVMLSFTFSGDGHDGRRTPGRARYMWNTVQGRAKFMKLVDLEDEAHGYVSDDILLIEFHVRD